MPETTYIIAVQNSKLFVKGSAVRDWDKKKMPFYTTEPGDAKSFIDEGDATDYKNLLVANGRKFRVEPHTVK